MNRKRYWLGLFVLLLSLSSCGGNSAQNSLEYKGTNDEGTFIRLPEDSLSAAERTVGYDAQTFQVSKAGWYQIKSEQDYDGYLNLYRAPFDPDEPAANLLRSNDDFGSETSAITFELEAETDYVIVTSACGVANDCGPARGEFTNTVEPSAEPPPPFTLPEPDPTRFNITLRFAQDSVTKTLTEPQRDVFIEAAEGWEDIITKDLADIQIKLPALDSTPGTGKVEGVLDDVLIDISFKNIDGRGGVLGQAGPRFTREPGSEDELLTVQGIMEFDISEFGNGGFFDTADNYSGTIFHEMGHVLGIGTLWQRADLTEGVNGDPPTVSPGAPNPAYDPRFIGEGAIREYQSFLQASNRAEEQSVPIANTGGPGSINGHWRELTFANELMTPFAGGTEILSRMTVASLADLGYTVDLNAAQEYKLPQPALFNITTPIEKIYREFTDFIVAAASPKVTLEAAVAAVDTNLLGSRENTSGCEPADFADFPPNVIALVQRGGCTFAQKVENAENAGAPGVIIFNQGDTVGEGDRRGPIGISLEAYEPSGPVLGASFAVGQELIDLENPEVFVDTGAGDETIDLQSIYSNKIIGHSEILLEPIGTVSPDGKVTFDD